MKSIKDIKVGYILKSRRHKVKDVFTPSCEATLNFIKRKKIEKRFESFYNQTGRQLFIYGYSRSGKSSFWENQVKEKSIRCITSRCKGDTTFVDLVRDCFNQLNPYYVASRTYGITTEVKNDFEAKYKWLKANASTTMGTSEDIVLQAVLPPQVTVQNLVHFVCEAGLVWVIEDFHYLNDDAMQQLAFTLKFFIDESVNHSESRVVCIGTSMDMNTMYANNPDLHSRIAHIQVNTFDPKEIQEIVDNGFDLLNIEVSETVKKTIVEYSSNDASVAHNLCYELCNQANVNESLIVKRQIPDSFLPKALKVYALQNNTQFNQKLDYINENEIRKGIIGSYREMKENSLSYKKITDHMVAKGYKEAAIKKEIQNLSDDAHDILRLDNVLNKYIFRNQMFKAYLEMVMENESKKEHLDAMLAEAQLIIKNQNDDDAMLWQSLSKNISELRKRMEEE